MSDWLRELMADPDIPFSVQPMEVSDIPQVTAIEKESFALPWSATSYRHELTQNDLSYYLVVRHQDAPTLAAQTPWLDRWLNRVRIERTPVVGYSGFWVLDDEAHISTIAVRPNLRGRGIGELLLVAMIEQALSLQTQVVTLEVRVSNRVAQNLYRKYLFEEVGRRRRYYRDNDEDALIMTTPDLDDLVFRQVYRRNRRMLYERLHKFKETARTRPGEPKGA